MEPAAAASASREDGAVAEAPGDPPDDPAPAPADGSAPLGQQGEMVHVAAQGQAGEQASLDAEDNGEGGAEARRAMIMENISHRRKLLEYVRSCRRVAEEKKASRLADMRAKITDENHWRELVRQCQREAEERIASDLLGMAAVAEDGTDVEMPAPAIAEPTEEEVLTMLARMQERASGRASSTAEDNSLALTNAVPDASMGEESPGPENALIGNEQQQLLSRVTIGSRLSIFWADDDVYYPGRAVNHCPSNALPHRYRINYDDGETEVVDLATEDFRILNDEEGAGRQDDDLSGDGPVEEESERETNASRPATDEWECTMCTLLNRKGARKCNACGTRPVSLSYKEEGLARCEEPRDDVEEDPGSSAEIDARKNESEEEEEEEEEEIDGTSGRATRAARKRKSEDESDDAPPKKTARKDPTGGNWGKMFAKLEAYKEENGNCNVPKKYPEDKQLGRWVGKQRDQYKLRNKGKRSTMTAERARKLERIDFVWDPYGERWDNMLTRLKEYRAKEGNCNVPSEYPEDKKLGTWVQYQRKQYKLRNKGKSNDMTDERLEQLERIGFVWALRDVDSSRSWEDSFQLLKAYNAEEGNCNVPNNYADDPRLGTWVKNQRTQYRLKNEGKHSHITAKRVEELNSIGFEWAWKHPSHKRDVEIVQQFHTRHGHCHVPHPDVTRCSELKSIWPLVSALRKRYRRGEPIPYWILEDLNEIGFEFDPPDRRPRDARVETDILHSMGVRYGIVFDTWDVTVDSEDDCRPDSTMYTHKPGRDGEPDSNVAIGAEKDEHRHDGEPVWKEQMKMNKFVKTHEEEFQSINFIRTNSAERKESDPRQEAKLQELIDHIEKVRLPGVHVWYLDYPEDHHHIVASRRRRRTEPACGSESWNYRLFDGVHDEWKSGCEPGK